MEAPKRKPLGTRPKASRRKVKLTETNIEDKKIRNEVSSVLDGLVYLTESVAKLERISRAKASQPKSSQPRSSRPKASRRKVKATEANTEDKKIRSEVASVLDGLVYLTESVAKLERRPRTRSANSVSRTKSKNLTSKPKTRPVSSRSRKSESDVIQGIRI
jgi:flagellar biosynthesis/type III secretory pathway ATPase